MDIKRKALINAVEQVKAAISSNTAVEELKHVWFDKKFVYGFDGGLGIRVPCKSDLEGGVLAGALLALLKSSNAEDVTLAFSKKAAEISMGRAKASVGVLPADRNPWGFPASPPKNATTMELSETILAGLKQARLVKATKPDKVYHYGVVMFPSKDFVTLYTTDSAALIQVTVKAKVAKELSSIVLPHAFVGEVLGFAGKNGGKIHFTEDSILAEVGDALVCSTLLDTADVINLPELVEGMVGEDQKRSALPENFAAALGRAGALVGPGEAYVKLTVNKKELHLQGRFKLGEIEERMSLPTAAPPGDIVVALDHLKTLSGGAAEFAVTDKALAFWGEDTLALVAAHDDQ